MPAPPRVILLCSHLLGATCVLFLYYIPYLRLGTRVRHPLVALDITQPNVSAQQYIPEIHQPFAAQPSLRWLQPL